MTATASNTKKPERLLQQASGVVPTPNRSTNMTIIADATHTVDLSTDPFAAVAAEGVRVVEVPDLTPPVLYVGTHRLALVTTSTDPGWRERAAAALLDEVRKDTAAPFGDDVPTWATLTEKLDADTPDEALWCLSDPKTVTLTAGDVAKITVEAEAVVRVRGQACVGDAPHVNMTTDNVFAQMNPAEARALARALTETADVIAAAGSR